MRERVEIRTPRSLDQKVEREEEEEESVGFICGLGFRVEVSNKIERKPLFGRVGLFRVRKPKTVGRARGMRQWATSHSPNFEIV